MPYSGAYSAAGAIGRTESAYFKTINAHGGINSRRVRVISLDEEYAPPKTLEQTRRLVEQEDVLAIVGSFGTPTNVATQKYLNKRHVPQLFIQAGASRWNDSVHFPWTMPLVDLLRSRLCENPRNRYPIRCRAGRIVALRFSEVGCSHGTLRRRLEPVAELPSARER
jgi:hypothetical protein